MYDIPHYHTSVHLSSKIETASELMDVINEKRRQLARVRYQYMPFFVVCIPSWYSVYGYSHLEKGKDRA